MTNQPTQPDPPAEPRRFWKSTIIIFSPFDPADVELSTLAREADEGSCYSPLYQSEVVDPTTEPEFPFEFFQVEEDQNPRPARRHFECLITLAGGAHKIVHEFTGTEDEAREGAWLHVARLGLDAVSVDIQDLGAEEDPQTP